MESPLGRGRGDLAGPSRRRTRPIGAVVGWKRQATAWPERRPCRSSPISAAQLSSDQRRVVGSTRNAAAICDRYQPARCCSTFAMQLARFPTLRNRQAPPHYWSAAASRHEPVSTLRERPGTSSLRRRSDTHPSRARGRGEGVAPTASQVGRAGAGADAMTVGAGCDQGASYSVAEWPLHSSAVKESM